MARRGVAGGRVGTTHLLSEERQDTFHFTMGPYSSPVLQIEPGDRVTVETRDAFGGVIHTEADMPSAKLTMPFVNPQNGPIMVEGAEKGDALAVYIESMEPRGDNPRGTCAMIPEFGALTGTSLTATLNQPLPETVLKQFLKTSLPNHMVPAVLVHFDSFPILGNAGKLDRKTIKQAALDRLGIDAGATPPAGRGA